MSQYTHLIFDLDDTLIDTSGILIPIRHNEEAFWQRISEPLPLLPGAAENLKYLSKHYVLCLLTQGNRRYQEQKINSMGVASFFSHIEIVEPDAGQTKHHFFSRFCEIHQVVPHRVLSIGNRLSTDVGPAKQAGMMTCWFRYGEGQEEEAQNLFEKPDFIVHNHYEMMIKCRL